MGIGWTTGLKCGHSPLPSRPLPILSYLQTFSSTNFLILPGMYNRRLTVENPDWWGRLRCKDHFLPAPWLKSYCLPPCHPASSISSPILRSSAVLISSSYQDCNIMGDRNSVVMRKVVRRPHFLALSLGSKAVVYDHVPILASILVLSVFQYY